MDFGYKVCIKSPCTVSTALLALIEVHGLLIQTLWFFGDFSVIWFLEIVCPNKFFAFMDFSLMWIILAGTNVVHISGIGCNYIVR